MSVVAIHLEEMIDWAPFHKLQEEIESSLGKIVELTDSLKKLHLKIVDRLRPNYADEERYKKMMHVALFVAECYVLYCFPIALVSSLLSFAVSERFADSVDGILTSLLFGGGIGRCLQIFAHTFYTAPDVWVEDRLLDLYVDTRIAARKMVESLTWKIFQNQESFPKELAPLKSKVETLSCEIYQFPSIHLLLTNGAN